MKTGKFLSKFLKAKDVKQPVTVTITQVDCEEFKEDGNKLVVYFRELEQGLIPAKTVIATLNELFSPEHEETDDWIGKQVILFNDPNVLYSGKRVGGLRVKAVE